jgi:RNA polymerase sigma-54 factor
MRLDTSQHMAMEQRMVLAPRMIQSMEILQLPLLALQERIEQEMLTNPVLEQEEPLDLGDVQADSANETPAETVTDGERTLRIEEDRDKAKEFERLDNVGDDYDDYLHRSSQVRARRSDGERDGKQEAMQNTAAPSQSLNEFLHDQWTFIDCNEAIHHAGDIIIDHIDDAGYLSVSLESLYERAPQVKPAQWSEALSLTQTLEPTGVGARDLAECMVLQLASESANHTLEIDLVKNHLKDIEMNRYPQISKKIGKSIAEIQDAVKNISRLDLRPGLQVGHHDTPYILPDIIVEYDEDNDVYTARLNDGSNPNLRINMMYSKMAKQGNLPQDAKEFLQNNIRSARWIIESIEQRKTTLLRVVNHVLKFQRDFFDFGPQHLRPLPMVDVAEVLGIHVGTVSRAVSGKYMQTPIGIYPLRSFFIGGTENAAGESVSWDAIKAKLREIVDQEDKKKPLNDDLLAEELTKHGLTVARRTVAKYRSILNIPPARRRKQFE